MLSSWIGDERVGCLPQATGPCQWPRLRPTWDFPGQEEYAAINALYLISGGLYVVCCNLSGDLSKEFEDARRWLVSLYLHSPRAAIVLIPKEP